MKILITGSKGLLGKYLLQTQPQKEFEGMGESNKHEIFTPTRQEMDVSNFDQVLKVCYKVRPEIIIHCAANGDVDDVEKNGAEALKSDLLGTMNLMQYCEDERMNCKLITISSNAVYKGDNPPYSEDSPREPVNIYGKIKSLADDIIMKSSCDWMIIRPIMLYGWPNEGQRGNWVTKLIENKKTIYLVNDSFTQPTYASDLALQIWEFIHGDWNEVYNFSSKEVVNIYEFGLAVKNVFGLKFDIMARPLGSFSSIAPRPVNTTFKCNNMFWVRNLTEGLTKMKNET